MSRPPLTGSGIQRDINRGIIRSAVAAQQYAPANPGDNSVVQPSGTPQVENLDAEASPGMITITWDAVSSRSLSHYLVQVSDEATFGSPSEYIELGTNFSYRQGTPLTDYYFRVKAVDYGGKEGDFSEMAIGRTGAVSAGEIDDGAVGEDTIEDGAVSLVKIVTGAIYNFTTVTGSPNYGLTSSYAEITGARVTQTLTDPREIVKISSTMNGTATIVGAPTATQDIISTRIERGSGASPSSWSTVRTAGDAHIPTDGAGIGTGVDAPDAPGVGVWTYRIVGQFTNLSNVGDTLVIDSFVLVAEKLSV